MTTNCQGHIINFSLKWALFEISHNKKLFIYMDLAKRTSVLDNKLLMYMYKIAMSNMLMWSVYNEKNFDYRSVLEHNVSTDYNSCEKRFHLESCLWENYYRRAWQMYGECSSSSRQTHTLVNTNRFLIVSLSWGRQSSL